MAQIEAEGSLTKLPSIGKGIAVVISELLNTGQSNELDRVRKLVPEKLPQLLRFRGLGPKRVRTLWQELDIKSPQELESAIHDGRVAKVKGFGAKTVENMLASIEYFRAHERTPKPLPQLENVPQAIQSSGAIFAGTSGYSYASWKGTFYPEKAKTAELLKHYAERLPTVEINNTFYRFPSEKVVDQWRSQTGDDFQFTLKAHRRVTHQMRLSQATKVRIQEFVDRCCVLGSRLGAILFQLPPDFERDDERLQNLLTAIPMGPRYAIEFRHHSWLVEDVLNELRQKNVACVCGDSTEDQPTHFATADFIYCRLRKTSYREDELDSWNHWFDQQREQGKDVLVFLKHDDSGDVPLTVARRWV